MYAPNPAETKKSIQCMLVFYHVLLHCTLATNVFLCTAKKTLLCNELFRFWEMFQINISSLQTSCLLQCETRGDVVIYYNYHLGDKVFPPHSPLTNQRNAGYFLPILTNRLLRILNFNGVTNAAGWTTANYFNLRWLMQNRMIPCTFLER